MAPSDDLPTEDLNDAIAWRYANYDTPFWARSNTQDGRWNTAGEASVQYLAMEPNGAWAELIRSEELRSEEEVATVRIPIWVAAVNEVVVDYSTFEKAEAAGFDPGALVDDDWRRCQDEGRRLRDLGYTEVIAPSARAPRCDESRDLLVSHFCGRGGDRWFFQRRFQRPWQPLAHRPLGLWAGFGTWVKRTPV